MVTFVKKFKDTVPSVVQMVLIGVIGLYALAFNNVNYSLTFLGVIASLLPVLLTVVSAMLLSVFNKQLPAHVVLLFGLFINSLFIFIRALFSLNFSPFSYTPGFTVEMFVNLLIFAYLLFMVISYVMNESLPKIEVKSSLFYVILIVFGFLWIFRGFNTALFSVLIPLVVLWLGTEFSSLLLLLGIVISQPFLFINQIVQSTLSWNDFGDYIFLIGSLVLIALLGKMIYTSIVNKQYQ